MTTGGAGSGGSPLRRWYRRHEGPILGAIGLAGLLGGWEIAAALGWINPIILASPSRIGHAVARQWRSGELLADLAITGVAFALAYALALLAGLSVGLAMGLFRDVEYALDPMVWFLYSAPLVVFQPLLVVWLGFGFWTVVALGAILAAFPIAVNTLAGVSTVDPMLRRAVRAFGGGWLDELVKVTWPASLPLVLAGLRIAAGRALVGIVVGEMFSANGGLGFRLTFYGARLRAADVLVSVLGVVVLGLVATQSMRVLEQRLRRGWAT